MLGPIPSLDHGQVPTSLTYEASVLEPGTFPCESSITVCVPTVPPSGGCECREGGINWNGTHTVLMGREKRQDREELGRARHPTLPAWDPGMAVGIQRLG